MAAKKKAATKSGTSVLTKCVFCQHRHTVQAGEVPAGGHPMCPKCGGPLVATGASA